MLNNIYIDKFSVGWLLKAGTGQDGGGTSWEMPKTWDAESNKSRTRQDGTMEALRRAYNREESLELSTIPDRCVSSLEMACIRRGTETGHPGPRGGQFQIMGREVT